MFTAAFWKATFERAVKTGAQAALLAFGASDAGPANLFELDWPEMVGFTGGGMILSVLSSLVTSTIGDNHGPSLAPASEVKANQS